MIMWYKIAFVILIFLAVMSFVTGFDPLGIIIGLLILAAFAVLLLGLAIDGVRFLLRKDRTPASSNDESKSFSVSRVIIGIFVVILITVAVVIFGASL